MELSVLLVFVAVVLITFLYQRRRKTTLPGPTGLPILGSLPFIGSSPHVALTKLAEKYGPAFGITLGSQYCVILNSHDALKDTFIRQSEAYSGRPHDISFRTFDYESAFGFLNGQDWKDSRGFSVSALKNLGFGRQSLEPVVLEEIQFFLEEVEKPTTTGKTPITRILEKSVGNAIASLLTGRRCDYNDPWFLEMEENLENFMKTIVNDFTSFLPWLSYVPIGSIAENVKLKKKLKLNSFKIWERKVEECKKDPNNTSYISMFLEEQKAQKEQTGKIKDIFSDFSLVSNLDILCLASFETTAVTLQWALYYLILNPETKKKLYKEIDEVLGRKNPPSYQHDAKNMHYTRAFIQEVHRMASLVPLGSFHITLDKATVFNHAVPKGTTVISNIWAVHRDPIAFPNPEKFDPQRFLDENGQYVKNEKVVPFSVGKRFCPGEYVAQMELFLYLTSILQAFDFEMPRGETLHVSKTDLAILRPDKYELVFKRRT